MSEVVVSIHAPAKGATATDIAPTPYFYCFNPRPREGGDGAVAAAGYGTRRVSIHAPAKGATTPSGAGRRARTFQSTPPAKGATAAAADGSTRAAVSIHAPAKGATRR